MTSSHLIFDEPAQWYFYAILLVFVGVIIYLAYLSVQAILALLDCVHYVRSRKKASVSTTAISTTVWFKAISRIAFCVFVICGTWIAINANFSCFRALDFVNKVVHLSYNLHIMDGDVPLSDIRSMTLEHVQRRDPKHPYFRLEITTVEGKVFRSIMTNDETVLINCQRVIDTLYKRAA